MMVHIVTDIGRQNNITFSDKCGSQYTKNEKQTTVMIKNTILLTHLFDKK